MMTVARFCLLHSCLLLLSASGLAHEIETESWGVCWKRLASMPSEIGPTNTPGADAFCQYRLSAPADLAFLDGFDTRLHAASCTNLGGVSGYEMLSDAFPKVTNTTHRLAFFDSLKRRKANVRRLCPWFDPVKFNSHNLYSGRWGSTYMDSLDFVAPKRHDFGWTTDPYSEFYSDGKTGWFSVFYGLKKTDVFSPHEEYISQGYQEQTFKYAGIAYEILLNVSFFEPYWHTFNNQARDATPFAFEVVLSNAFENVACSNLLSSSRRLFTGQIAGCNQALALMDKTVRIDDELYAVTNMAKKHFKSTMSASGTYGGIVTITGDAGGGYTASPLDLSFVPDGIAVSNAVSVTNELTSRSSPALKVSVPSCAFGAALSITNASSSLSLDGMDSYLGITLRETLDWFFDDVAHGEIRVEVHPWKHEGLVDLEIYYEGKWNVFTMNDVLIKDGSYPARGNAAFSTSIYAVEAYRFQRSEGRENWPANRTYLKNYGLKTTFVTGYAATRAYHSYGNYDLDPISFTWSSHSPQTTEQWNERVGYGYRAKTYEMNFPLQYYGPLALEIGNIATKMFELAPDYDDPLQYVGVDEGDFRGMCARADQWALAIGERWFGKEEAYTGEIDYMLVTKDGESYRFRFVGSSDEYTGGFPVHAVSASLNLVDDEVLDVYEFPDKPFVFNSNIRSVSEAEWYFPQVRLKGEQ